MGLKMEKKWEVHLVEKGERNFKYERSRQPKESLSRGRKDGRAAAGVETNTLRRRRTLRGGREKKLQFATCGMGKNYPSIRMTAEEESDCIQKEKKRRGGEKNQREGGVPQRKKKELWSDSTGGRGKKERYAIIS